MTHRSITNEELAALVQRTEEATSAFMRGDMHRYLTLTPHARGFVLMNPFGGEPTRYDDRSESLLKVADYFKAGEATLEVAETYASGDLVVLVMIERQHGEVGGLPDQEWSLRVTQVYRREGSEWRLVHCCACLCCDLGRIRPHGLALGAARHILSSPVQSKRFHLMADSDREANRFSARAARYARVGANMGGVAARMAGSRLFGGDARDASNAAVLAQALGGLKGPIMKVAQLLATIPDLIPPEYATELQKLQSEAPPMGAAFVKRRMQAELGPDWQRKFGFFDLKPAAAASLGQVHRATTTEGSPLACKLQYPDMQSAVEADLGQLEMAFALHRRLDPAIDTREIAVEIGERVREELDYGREAKHAALYAHALREIAEVRVPDVHPDLSTKRLLSLG